MHVYMQLLKKNNQFKVYCIMCKDISVRNKGMCLPAIFDILSVAVFIIIIFFIQQSHNSVCKQSVNSHIAIYEQNWIV